MSEETSVSQLPSDPHTPIRPTSSNISLKSTSSSTRDPVALATTKRKFHKLLDGLTRTSSSKPSPAAESTAKRIRLEARSRLDASNPTNTSATTAYIQSQLLSSRLAAARTPKPSEAPVAKAVEPHYVPWSHEQFLRRLKTFADLKSWTSKPDAVNEVEWAKRGWVCVEVNTVGCRGGCEQRVVVGLRPGRKDDQGVEIEGSEDYSVEIADELIERYVELIATGHDESCLWRENGCRDDIYRLPIAKESVWQPQLRARYQSLLAMSAHLPPPDRLSQSIVISNLKTHLPADFFSPPTPTFSDVSSDAALASTTAKITPLNHAALDFALHGWTGNPSAALATCPACFRRLGLWLYAKRSGVETSNDDDDENQMMKLDLIQNHREYCPWINAESQSMPGSFAGLAGWEILARLVRNTSSPPRRISAEDTVANDAVEDAQSGGDIGVTVSTPRKDYKEVEKEDKVRFARLRELTRAMGLKRSKKA